MRCRIPTIPEVQPGAGDRFLAVLDALAWHWNRRQDLRRFFRPEAGRSPGGDAISFAVWMLCSATANSRRIRLRAMPVFATDLRRGRGDSPASIPVSNSAIVMLKHRAINTMA